MPFTLLVVAGEREGESFQIPENRAFTIGRDACNDIRLHDRKLSRIHCQIQVRGGQCQITDLNSTNGTVVRDQRIVAETDLALGDEVVVGTNRLRLVEVAPDTSKAPKPETRPLPEEPRGEGPPRCEECGRTIPLQDLALEKVRTVGTRHYCANCAASFDLPTANAAPAAQPLPAAILERFRPGRELAGVRVVSLIGEGRLGPLFKGEQVNVARPVALKVLNVPDERWTQRYLQAVYASGQLVHSDIVLIFDIGQEENFSYVVREYVEGRSLQERLANHEPAPTAEAHSVISQVVRALEYAAERHIFHGALSPRKILLGPRGSVKVFGFGLPLAPPRSGALSRDWHALPYTAPERVRGDDSLNFAGDVYSVVALLYHLLSGHPPFSGTPNETIEQRILSAQPKPLNEFVPNVPAGAQKIMDRGLSQDPRARYQLPRELLFDLEAILKRAP
jgi:pSer/pThr/pTyr-binding forkhead associated (FHA) protein